MNPPKNQGLVATVIGSTGLIGSDLVRQLLQEPAFTHIRLLVRRPVDPPDSRVSIHLLKFTDRSAFRQGIAGSDVVFCAIGTTTKQVNGNEAAYRAVDYDIPVTAAQLAKESGVGHFSLVSAIGANATGSSFYIRLKGEVENAIRLVDLPSVALFQPSLLLGSRSEFRLGERLAELIMIPASFLIPADYKPIQASAVASAMIAASLQAAPGVMIYRYSQMRALTTAKYPKGKDHTG